MSEATVIKRRGNPAMQRGAASLNPRGRPPRGTSLAERVRAAIDPGEIIDFLDSVWRDSQHRIETRVAAASQVLDRGWGRPMQSVELDATFTAAAALPANWATMTPVERGAFLDRVANGGFLSTGDDL
jgi:hypothetical protein